MRGRLRPMFDTTIALTTTHKTAIGEFIWPILWAMSPIGATQVEYNAEIWAASDTVSAE